MKKLNANDGADPLSDALEAVRFRSTIFCRSEMSAPWGFSVAGRDFASFHFIERGDGWLEVDGNAPKLRLGAGDLVVLPHGHPHRLRDSLRSPVTRLDDLVAAHAPAGETRLTFGGGGAQTVVVCGGFLFENRDALPFLPALPPVLLLRDGGGRAATWLRLALEVIPREIQANRLGEGTILSRLSDLIFIEAVRTYFSDASGGPRGWFAALKDRHIGTAIALMHRELRRPWTVGKLASAVGMSRSAFALRFSVLLGESPIHYLVRRRLARACRLLEGNGVTIARVADEVGYESDVAFSRAFKRQLGLSPADYRRGRGPTSAGYQY
jgi:AraC-like DNA-binding protein